MLPIEGPSEQPPSTSLNTMSTIPILMFGATGYIGGCVLARLLAHPNAKTYDITVLVRSAEKAKKFETFGVKAVVGSFKDSKLVEELSEQAHVIFSCADADDLPFAQAFLAGLKKRHEKLGELPILIHTSGTGVLTFGQDEVRGNVVTETIFEDSNVEQIENIPTTALHREIDLAIVQADKDGYARTHIILPATVYGIASNPLVDAGIQNPFSIQIPFHIKGSLDRGQPGMVGKGVPIWGDVHIDDCADLFIVLWNAINTNPDSTGHGRNGYYFATNGEHAWYEVCKEIGRAMVALGLSKSDEPTSFTDEELLKYFGSLELGYYHGTNSRARATHSMSIGWKPKHTSQDLIASIRVEVETFVKRLQK